MLDTPDKFLDFVGAALSIQDGAIVRVLVNPKEQVAYVDVRGGDRYVVTVKRDRPADAKPASIYLGSGAKLTDPNA